MLSAGAVPHLQNMQFSFFKVCGLRKDVTCARRAGCS